MIRRIRVPVCHQAGYVVQVVADTRQSATGSWAGQEWRGGVAIKLDVVVPDFGNNMILARVYLVFHTTGEPET